ncbi:hypothetical protein ZHAS_00008823 [Anopheles sinensis]|uniref:Uncharacterized protein n=1 Tax=Anopheles sinensis TaxID=74873 RepID=A0A084VTE1_ANOSI|nr:hypothetical protein ZHAS_00008823 [Anopheles sinensis]
MDHRVCEAGEYKVEEGFTRTLFSISTKLATCLELKTFNSQLRAANRTGGSHRKGVECGAG